MNWITDAIAIGNVHEARDRELLRQNAIRSILGLIDVYRGTTPADLGVSAIEVVPLVDGEGNDLLQFGSAVTKLSRLAEQAGPVLVHCHLGLSRSPAVVVAYLIRYQGFTLDQAVAEVMAKRVCGISGGLLRLVERYCRVIPADPRSDG